MMSRIDRLRHAVSAHKAARADGARAAKSADTGSANLPVPVGPVTAPRSFKDEWRSGDSELEAQFLGQDGELRGLRAGPSLLERARRAYTLIEWSGSYDRRARKGRGARTEI